MTYWRSIAPVFLTIILVGAGGFLTGQSLTVKVRLSACADVPKLFRFNGFSFEELQTAKPGEAADSYTIPVPKGEPAFYYIGQNNQSLRPLILGPEEGVSVSGACDNARSAEVEGSVLNDQYEAIKTRMSGLRQRFSSQLMTYRSAKNQEDIEKVLADMRGLDQEKTQFLDSLKQANPFFARIVALNTYLSFFNNNHARYGNELEYFAAEYFRFADFTDTGYEYLPWVFEAFQSYTQTLTSVGLPDEVQKTYLEKALAQLPAGSVARQLGYGGAIAVMEQREHPNLAPFAEAYLAEYPDADNIARQRLEQVVARVKAFAVGGVAPDFTQQTPEGKDLRLSDLRGKVVLIDFWASWCGPCRRENPNVVRMYQEYKDKGFEILGVSLDKDRDRWLQAIEADGLTWRHVSDLKYWQNEVAQMYGVRSIPHTLLLDREGRIVARNLRGEALEQKLEEIFN